MNLKDMQEKQVEAQKAEKYYKDLIIEHVEGTTFTGKELLEMIRSKKNEPMLEGDPYKIFAGLLMEIIKERETSET